MRNETSLYEGFKIVEYEKEILSICLAGANRAADMEIIFENLKPEYFNERSHADVFRAFLDLANGVYSTPVPYPIFQVITSYVKSNAGRYDTFRRLKESEQNGADDIGNFMRQFAVDDAAANTTHFMINQIIECYKTRERWRIGVELQQLSGEVLDTAERRGKLYAQLAELENLGNGRYIDYFTPSTLASTSAALKAQGAGLSTGYTLGKEQHGQIIRRDFTIPPRQITVIAAATGHGKSTFCYNLALRLIARNKRPDGNPIKIVYLSYEESAHNIEPKIINVMAGLNLAEDNRAAIAADIAAGGTGAFITDPRLRREYCDAVKRYYDLSANGTLTVKYCDLDTSELCGLIREYRRRNAADVVIIDYVQLQEKESSKAHGRNRPDELKEICADLRKLANDEKLGLPVIIASQFNREVQKSNDPRIMDKTNLGESANIEHSANVILGIWNCLETNAERYYKTDKDGEITNELTADGERLLRYQHTKNIDDPFVYVRLLKSRDGINGLNATLNYYGNCGRIDNTTDITPNERAGKPRDETTEPHNTMYPAIMDKTGGTAKGKNSNTESELKFFGNDDLLPF